MYVEAEVLVDRDIPEHSIMIEGRLDDWDSMGTASTTSIMENTVLMEVVQFKKTPDLSGRNFERTVSLARYRKTLPTVQA